MSAPCEDLLLHYLMLGKWKKDEYLMKIVRARSSGLEDNLGLIIVIGQVPEKSVSKIQRFVCKSLLGNMLWEPASGVLGGEGARTRQRELNQDPVLTEASADPIGSSGAGMALDSCH